MKIEELNELHRALRRHRYLYYEMDTSEVSDYDYDMLEKKYIEGCDRLGIQKIKRIDNYVGFNIRIPMNLSYK